MKSHANEIGTTPLTPSTDCIKTETVIMTETQEGIRHEIPVRQSIR